MLTYKPHTFFNYLDYVDELAKKTGSSKATVRTTISRAKRDGLLRIDGAGKPYVTWRGTVKAKVAPKKKLRHWLIIAFDIPEARRKQRDHFRAYLYATNCELVQKSVWKTRYDIVDELGQVVADLNIDKFVNLFMADDI